KTRRHNAAIIHVHRFAGTTEFSLITVAQALHWFNIDFFFKEVKRVLKPGGILAVWTSIPSPKPIPSPKRMMS
ncbi:MAG: class I SAM-dependent methyltransferase, partial [Gammaproteobacteria bacterium]|nr:class I SAM-dependent methyltransferase [Gammaproteobacteria bacterium]